MIVEQENVQQTFICLNIKKTYGNEGKQTEQKGKYRKGSGMVGLKPKSKRSPKHSYHWLASPKGTLHIVMGACPLIS